MALDDQERPVDIATWRVVVKIAIVVFTTTRDNETIKAWGRSGDFHSIHPTGLDSTRFCRHIAILVPASNSGHKADTPGIPIELLALSDSSDYLFGGLWAPYA